MPYFYEHVNIIFPTVTIFFDNFMDDFYYLGSSRMILNEQG